MGKSTISKIPFKGTAEQEQKLREFIAANKGISEKVLFESTDRKGMMEGYTGNYIRISQPYDPEKIGRIVDIVI